VNTIEEFTIDTVSVVSKLVEEGFYTQALIIIYSAIDTLAWANLPSGEVKEKDFIAWVSKYLQPEQKLGCTAGDLYGSRCGLVHSNTTESRKSRNGDTNEIWYTTSPSSISGLQRYAKQLQSSARVIHFAYLLSAFIDAAEGFGKEIALEQTKQQNVNERIKHWIKFVPAKVIVQKNETG